MVNFDAKLIDSETDLVALFEQALWPTVLKLPLFENESNNKRLDVEDARLPPPKWWLNRWKILRKTLLAAGDDWEVWTQWYESLANHPSTCWRLPRQRADAIMAEALQWDEAEWEKGSAHVNRRIRELIEGAGGSLTPDIYEPPADEPDDPPPLPESPPQKRAAIDAPGSRDFFISYSSWDEAMAREVSAVLEEAGHNTFAQFRDMPVGSNFVTEMQRGLEGTSRVVALYSPRYVASHQCQAEWNAAYNADPSGAQRKLVPFLVEATELPPLARQVVFKSLVGLKRAARKKAILEAIRSALVIPVPDVIYAQDFDWTKRGQMRAQPSPHAAAFLPSVAKKTSHKERLTLARKAAKELADLLNQSQYQFYDDMRTFLADYRTALPATVKGRNFLDADSAYRSLRDLFQAEHSTYGKALKIRLRRLMEAHLALREFYPGAEKFNQSVRGETDGEIDRIEAGKRLGEVLAAAPELFETKAIEVVRDAEPRVAQPKTVSTVPPSDSDLLPPPDPYGPESNSKAATAAEAGIINRWWEVFLSGEKIAKNAEAWKKVRNEASPIVRDVIDWITKHLPNIG